MTLTTLVLSLLVVHTGIAADLYPWNNHAPPFTFLFNEGMHIDTHQQTRLDRNGNLIGFLYIEFTGAVSKDGFRVASHTDCNATGADCTVGWLIGGKPVTEATLVYHVEEDHPTWLVDRAAIPQPGSYSHFHWIGATDHGSVGTTLPGYLLQLTAIDTFCFVHHDASMFDDTKTCEDDVNNGVIIRPGVDIATHVNIVGSYPIFVTP
jgi:hypothetical protein